MSDVVIVALSEPVEDAYAVIAPLVDEYVWWCVDELAERGAVSEDRAAVVARHRILFRDKLPELLGPRGRLLVALTGGDAVGLGALEPIDSAVAEIKRMYVRPAARGAGIARALLDRLVCDAAALGFRTARLETATFMIEAQSLYLSMGFVDIPMFGNSETSHSGLESQARFMHRPLVQPQVSAARTFFRSATNSA
ncbi:GNAT family N-acetyltransferase [Nocardia sp. NPDC127526]|uniref:GNAT family N-acetyltransferase n=1 Tax=Nocardia sp. NPDC127526 TaxID=3345393 RepID=UPI00362EEF32